MGRETEASRSGRARRFPPVSSIIAGTTDVNNGFAHWTAANDRRAVNPLRLSAWNL